MHGAHIMKSTENREEQKGENRAEYGKYLLKELSEYESKSDERNGCQEALLGKMRITAKISTERF